MTRRWPWEWILVIGLVVGTVIACVATIVIAQQSGFTPVENVERDRVANVRPKAPAP